MIEYAVDYDYISTVLCVNKDKPALKCNGKCHLMQELAKAADEEKAASTSSNNKKVNAYAINDLFVRNVNEFVFDSGSYATAVVMNSKYTNLYSSIDTNRIFHPPIFIS